MVVHETFNGETVWDGEDHTFDLQGHPTAQTAYAWTAPVEDSDRLRYYAILLAGPVRSAADAVRAAIPEEYHHS